jgi:hypothetical protein
VETGFTDFFSSARDKISSILPGELSTPGTPANSQLMDAIYSLGRGAFDTAREKAVGAFLATGEGQKVQQDATSQTIQKYFPYIVALVVGIFALGFLVRR